MTDWTMRPLTDLVRFSSGKAIKPGLDGPFPAYGSNGRIGGAAEARHDRGVIIGRVGAYCGSVELSNSPFWASDNTIVAEPRIPSDLEFAFYLLQNAKLNQHAGGSAQPLVTQTTLKSLEFLMPGGAARRSIGGILGAIDDLIENNRGRVELLEQMAQAIYREWFVHFRYPGHEHDELGDSPLGPIPTGWTVSPFNGIANYLNGYAFKPSDLGDSGLPVIKIKELKGGVTSATPRNQGDRIQERYRVHNGSLLFSWSADLDAYLWSGGPGLLNQHLFKVTPSAGIEKSWLYLALRSAMSEFRSRSQGTTMKHIKRAALSEVYASVPTQELATRFADVAEPILQESLALVSSSRALVGIRDFLLPGLVTGRIDVSRLNLESLLEGAGA
jgi:type I restriction enzyme, S subunit